MRRRQVKEERLIMWAWAIFGLVILNYRFNKEGEIEIKGGGKDPLDKAIMKGNGFLSYPKNFPIKAENLGIPIFLADFRREYSLVLLLESALDFLGIREDFKEADFMSLMDSGLKEEKITQGTYDHHAVRNPAIEARNKLRRQIHRLPFIMGEFGCLLLGKNHKDPYGRTNQILFPFTLQEPTDPELINSLEVLQRSGYNVKDPDKKTFLIRPVPDICCLDLIYKNRNLIEDSFPWFSFDEQKSAIRETLLVNKSYRVSLLDSCTSFLKGIEGRLDSLDLYEENNLLEGNGKRKRLPQYCQICEEFYEDSEKHMLEEHHIAMSAYKDFYPLLLK